MTSPILIIDVLHEPTQQALEAKYTCSRYWTAPDKRALLAQLAPDCRIIVTKGGRGATIEEMEQLPKLELVSFFGVGVEAVDLNYTRRRGIRVTNTPDVLTEDVADMALALLLATVRRLPYGDQYVRQGHWHKGDMALTASLQRRKVGIVGLGRIGQAIARRCLAFNTEVAYYGPRRKADVPYAYFESTAALAHWADVLIAACPGGEATRKIVSRAALQALGRDGVFVNISRGSVVDQEALVEMLGAREIAGAGLDVFNDEPRVPAALLAMDHVVLQPHQGSATEATRMAMGRIVLDNVARYLASEPLLTPV